MTYEIYRIIFVTGSILTGIMLVTSAVLFILLKIPSVIGDLSGKTAKRAIQDIREQNEKTGDKVHKTSHVNRERGKITARMTPSGKVEAQRSDWMGTGVRTGKISPEMTEETDVITQTTDKTVLLTEHDAAADMFAIEYEITFLHTDEIIA